MSIKPLADPRWDALVARDERADGTFVYAVKTTGVYCRPACASRLPRQDNVAFYDTATQAERAGFRACKRCRPAGTSPVSQSRDQILELCRFIETSERIPTLQQLAERLGLSPFHTHRLFKATTGVTPRAYARARREQRLRAGLETGQTVTQALYGAGYNSGGHFYGQADAVLGMTPKQFKAGGMAEEISFATAKCSLGIVLVATTERGVCAILLGDDAETLAADLRRRFVEAQVTRADKIVQEHITAVVALIEEPKAGLTLPLDIRGTLFQRRVWQALQQIAVGTTTTYSELATALGTPKAVRAVANACAANRLALAVPCHRVVRNDGSLSGYRWGVERKRALLEREKQTKPPARRRS